MVEPPVVGNLGKPIGKQSSKSKLNALLDNRWAVLAAIFFAMMFLGLPLLWRCPAFSRFEKLVWTIVVLIYSGLVFWLFYIVMVWCYGRITQSLGV